MDAEDPLAAEAVAVAESARLLAADQVQWAAAVAAVWTARTVRPELREVLAFVMGAYVVGDNRDGAAVAAEDLDHNRREEAEGEVAAALDLVVLVLVPSAAEMITACTADTADTADLEATAVHLRLITFGTVVVMATQEIMSGTTVAEEGQAEALGLLGLVLPPDRITHSRTNHNTSNRIDMAMVGMDLETIVASDLLPPNNPTRTRALRRHSGKLIRARIRHNTTDRQDPEVVAEQVSVSVAVVWAQAALCLLRQRGELLNMSKEWEEAAVSEPLARIITTPPTSGREQDHHRHHRLDRCNTSSTTSTSNTSKAHPWHLRGQGKTNLSRSLPHRHHLLVK